MAKFLPGSLQSGDDLHHLGDINWLLTDVDDTLTWQGKLPPQTLLALTRLQQAGVKVVAVTGACAGWCDQMAKLWPLHGVIGENGAFWMSCGERGFTSHFTRPATEMKRQQTALLEAVNTMLQDYPGVTLAPDQAFRFCDVAVNIAQDREPVDSAVCDELLRRIQTLEIDSQPVNATQSSVHINAWIGAHSKRSSSEAYLRHMNHGHIPALDQLAYVGDSRNDEGMFAWLPLTFGVNNIRPLLPQMTHQPRYITQADGGLGFAELAEQIVQARLDVSGQPVSRKTVPRKTVCCREN